MASAHRTTDHQPSCRLRRGLLANAMAVILRIATQLGLLPLLFIHWNRQEVGIWLMLFSLPMIFHIASTVFFAAGSNVALMDRANIQSAQAAFRSSVRLANAATLALILLGIIAFVVSNFAGARWSGLLLADDMGALLAIFAAYVIANVPLAAMEVPLRHAGRYPDHIALQAAALACEALAIGTAVVLGAGLLEAAAAMLVTRVIFAVGVMGFAHKLNPAIFATRGHLKAMERHLIGPALGFMALPLVYAVNLSGYTLLIGFAFGPVILATFVATRTLIRLIDLVTNFLFAAQYYEAGHAHSDPQKAQQWQRRLLATMTLLTGLFAALFTVAMLAIGGWLQHWWTAGQTQFDQRLALVLLLAGAIRILCASPAALLSAANKHTGFARAYLLGSLAAFGLGGLLAWNGADLVVICAMLIVAEFSQLVPIMRAALKAMDMSLRAFLVSIVSGQRLSDMRELAVILKPRKTSD